MEQFLSFLVGSIFIWLILTLFIPKKVAPFFISKPRLKVFGLFILSFVISSIYSSFNTYDKKDTIESASVHTMNQAESAIEKKRANDEVMQILGNTPQIYDQVDKVTRYRTWGTDKYPPVTTMYWYAVEQDKYILEYLKLVHFTDTTDWVFWDKLVFSTDQGKWEYAIDAFAGQSGAGKNTQIVRGGKYETLDVRFEKLKPGIELIINGTNPIIRFVGNRYYDDYNVDPETIERLKQAYTLNKDLEIIMNKVE